MTDPRSEPAASVALETAARLRDEILLEREDGVYLGSEAEIQARFGVSRPTLRQAARVLEHEHLLEVRRGSRGGLFSRAPSADAVSHAAAVYLRYQGTTRRDLYRATALVVPEIARCAARNPSRVERASLAEFARSPEHAELVGTTDFMRNAVGEFGLRLIALIDNPPLSLFYEMLLDLTVSLFPGHALGEKARERRVIRFHRDLGSAVAAGDEAVAVDITLEYFGETGSWFD